MLAINDVKSFNMINLKTGEKVLNVISDFKPVIEPEMWSINSSPSYTLTCEDVTISDEFKKLLFNNQKWEVPKYNMEVQGYRTISVQARKHRAKRINKKWLKRYGYKEIQVLVHIKMDECEISKNEDEDFNTYNFSVYGKFGSY